MAQVNTNAVVIGLGVAGVNLCHALEKAGIDFHAIDPCIDAGASWIAGGIFNPVVFKRKVKTWQADVLFAALETTYAELEVVLGTTVLHHVPIIKPIFSDDELREWQSATANGSLAPYLLSEDIKKPAPPVRTEAVAQLHIRHSGFVDLKSLITHYRKRLTDNNRLTVAQVKPERTLPAQIADDLGINAQHVFNCTGIGMRHDLWFGWLPMRPTKGQMLTVDVGCNLPRAVFNQNFYLFPGQGNVHRLGATYEWHDLFGGPTQTATDELLGRAHGALNLVLQPIDAQTAVRPTVTDRRPLIGTEFDRPNLHLFNGMGSKGVMLAPYFAKHLVDHVYGGQPLDPEVDLARFRHAYRI